VGATIIAGAQRRVRGRPRHHAVHLEGVRRRV